MIRSWVQLLGVAALAAAMLGAPCRDCFPREETPATAPCGHDCCPKPRPAKESSKPCSWQPAGFDALETVKQLVAPGMAAVPLPAARALVSSPATGVDPVRADWHAPPCRSSGACLAPLRI